MMKKLLIATGILGAIVVLLTLLFWPKYPSGRVQPGMVIVSLIGYETNATSQRCVKYRIQSQSPEPLLTLLEFPASPPGTGLFVRLPDAQPQEAVLPTPPPGSSNQVQLTCFTVDRGPVAWIYHHVEQWRGRSPHEISKLMFQKPGPPADL
jgi:hypothetical protein